jgi:hypothetical protein
MDPAERQVDAFALHPRHLRQRVLVVALGGAAHQQQVAMTEQEFRLARGVIAAAQQEPPRCAEAQRSDQRRRPQLGLVIAVPAHVVGAAAIAVEQYAVESTDALGL